MKKIRKKCLWQGPLYCAAAGILSWYATILLGPLYIEKTLQADGSTLVTVNPIISTVFELLLSALIILAGGFLLFRRMTRLEAAAGCALFAAVQLIMTLAEILSPRAGNALLWSVEVRNAQGMLGSLLIKAGLGFELSAILASLWPLVFIFFGRKAVKNE